MATRQDNTQLASTVALAIRHAGLTNKQVAVKAGINYKTLLTKIDGESAFSGPEIILIAQAIQVMPSELMALVEAAVSAA